MDLESEIMEHALVDILNLVNIGTVLDGLDVVVTEGIGSFRDHAAADGCPGDEGGGDDGLILGLPQGIAGAEGSGHMVIAVLNIKMVILIGIVDVSVFHMGEETLLQHIGAVAAGNIPGLKRLGSLGKWWPKLLKTGKIDVFVIAGIVEHPGQLTESGHRYHRNVFHKL